MVKITCDRCGKELNGDIQKNKASIFRGGIQQSHSKDFCDKCYEDLKKVFFETVPEKLS